MKKPAISLLVVLCVVLLCAALFGACSAGGDKTYVDGIYRAEFSYYTTAYDPAGYKDYLRVVVDDGEVVSIEYDAVNEEGKLRSASNSYEEAMLKVSNTSPKRYSADLINQYFEKGNINEVDAIAGATWASESFKALFTALEDHMLSGNTDTVVIDNVPVR